VASSGPLPCEVQRDSYLFCELQHCPLQALRVCPQRRRTAEPPDPVESCVLPEWMIHDWCGGAVQELPPKVPSNSCRGTATVLAVTSTDAVVPVKMTIEQRSALPPCSKAARMTHLAELPCRVHQQWCRQRHSTALTRGTGL
jgi:hypothetical protein